VEEEYKRHFQEDDTTEFLNDAAQYDLEFPIPPQEKNMKRFKWTIIVLLVAGLILFSQSARAADTSDVIIGIVGGIALGMNIDKKDGGSGLTLDISQYEVAYITPDGTLVLTPITSKKNKKKKEPPCARSGIKSIPPAYPGGPTGKIVYPVCPNWSLPYGGLYNP